MQVREWQHDGRRIHLDVLILRALPPSDLTAVAAHALIDTGANVSGISSRIAEQLDLPSIGKRPLITANGTLQTDRYAFRIGIADTEVAFPFLFEELIGFGFVHSDNFDAVVGMDILNQCDFSLSLGHRCRLAFG